GRRRRDDRERHHLHRPRVHGGRVGAGDTRGPPRACGPPCAPSLGGPVAGAPPSARGRGGRSHRGACAGRRTCTSAVASAATRALAAAGEHAGAAAGARPADWWPMATAIVVRGLTRRFGAEPAVDGLSLDIETGEVLALLGPNGAGKTTTIRLLNGVLRPDAGTSLVLGFDPVTQGNEVRRRSGVLTENAGLDDRLTALENLVLYARIRGMDGGV